MVPPQLSTKPSKCKQTENALPSISNYMFLTQLKLIEGNGLTLVVIVWVVCNRVELNGTK